MFRGVAFVFLYDRILAVVREESLASCYSWSTIITFLVLILYLVIQVVMYQLINSMV